MLYLLDCNVTTIVTSWMTFKLKSSWNKNNETIVCINACFSQLKFQYFIVTRRSTGGSKNLERKSSPYIRVNMVYLSWTRNKETCKFFMSLIGFSLLATDVSWNAHFVGIESCHLCKWAFGFLIFLLILEGNNENSLWAQGSAFLLLLIIVQDG